MTAPLAVCVACGRLPNTEENTPELLQCGYCLGLLPKSTTESRGGQCYCGSVSLASVEQSIRQEFRCLGCGRVDALLVPSRGAAIRFIENRKGFEPPRCIQCSQRRWVQSGSFTEFYTYQSAKNFCDVGQHTTSEPVRRYPVGNVLMAPLTEPSSSATRSCDPCRLKVVNAVESGERVPLFDGSPLSVVSEEE